MRKMKVLVNVEKKSTWNLSKPKVTLLEYGAVAESLWETLTKRGKGRVAEQRKEV